MPRLLVCVAILAACGLAVSTWMFSTWSSLEQASKVEASAAFATEIARAGDGPAYIEIDGGDVHVRRELERDEPHELAVLDVLAWEPQDERLVRVAFPFWFVRVKTTDALNLGTLVSALAGDWDSLNLSVSVEDLERRGPGLVLDHTRADGARIVLITRE